MNNNHVALDTLMNVECGIPLDDLSERLEAMEKALAKLGIYVGIPNDPEKNLPNYKVDTKEGLKWGTTDEFEQKAVSATFTVYFMKDHRNDN